MNLRRLPVWAVVFTFLHFGISVGVPAARGILGFPLLSVIGHAPVESVLFANSVLWALGFVAVVIYATRVP